MLHFASRRNFTPLKNEVHSTVDTGEVCRKQSVGCHLWRQIVLLGHFEVHPLSIGVLQKAVFVIACTCRTLVLSRTQPRVDQGLDPRNGVLLGNFVRWGDLRPLVKVFVERGLAMSIVAAEAKERLDSILQAILHFDLNNSIKS